MLKVVAEGGQLAFGYLAAEHLFKVIVNAVNGCFYSAEVSTTTLNVAEHLCHNVPSLLCVEKARNGFGTNLFDCLLGSGRLARVGFDFFLLELYLGVPIVLVKVVFEICSEIIYKFAVNSTVGVEAFVRDCTNNLLKGEEIVRDCYAVVGFIVVSRRSVCVFCGFHTYGIFKRYIDILAKELCPLCRECCCVGKVAHILTREILARIGFKVAHDFKHVVGVQKRSRRCVARICKHLIHRAVGIAVSRDGSCHRYKLVRELLSRLVCAVLEFSDESCAEFLLVNYVSVLECVSILSLRLCSCFALCLCGGFVLRVRSGFFGILRGNGIVIFLHSLLHRVALCGNSSRLINVYSEFFH